MLYILFHSPLFFYEISLPTNYNIVYIKLERGNKKNFPIQPYLIYQQTMRMIILKFQCFIKSKLTNIYIPKYVVHFITYYGNIYCGEILDYLSL